MIPAGIVILVLLGVAALGLYAYHEHSHIVDNAPPTPPTKED